MAINPNNHLDAKHTAYTAMTGGGKGVAVQNMRFIPLNPHLVIFDPYKEYVFKRGDKYSGFRGKKVYHYKTRRNFVKAFVAAWGSKKPFYIAYSPTNPTRADMLWLCSFMWQAADGKRELHFLIEELAKYSLGAGAEPNDSPLAECFTGGRKFGLVMHITFQTPSEVSKSTTKQCAFKVVGTQESLIECKRMASEIDKQPEDIGKLKKCEYWVKRAGWGNVEKVSLRHLFDKFKKEDKKSNAPK